MTIDELTGSIMQDTDHRRRNQRIRALESVSRQQVQPTLLSRCCMAGGGPFLEAVSDAMSGPKPEK